MFIKNCLTPMDQLCIAYPTTTVKEVLQWMNDKRLQSLPVIDEKQSFLGMISKRKLFELLEFGLYQGDWDAFLNLSIEKAIEPNIPSLTLEDKFEDTLSIIVRVPFVPILDKNKEKLLGIVKRSHVTSALEDAFGVKTKGIRLIIGMVESSGQLDKIQHIIYSKGINIITNVAFDAGDPYLRRVLVKISPVSEEVLNKLLTQLTNHGFKILMMDED